MTHAVVAELDLGSAHAVHGDRADGREGGEPSRDIGGNRYAQVGGHPVDLAVQRVLVAGARHPLTDDELGGPAPDLDHLSAEGVAEGRQRVETRRDLLVRGDRAELRRALDDLSDLLGPSARLGDQRQLRLFDLHHLGAGRDERVEGSDEHAARLARRRGDVEHLQVAGPVVLRHELHVISRVDGVGCEAIPRPYRHPDTPRARGLLVPELEAQQLPDLLGAVLSPGAFLLDQALHAGPSDEARLDQLARHEHVVDERLGARARSRRESARRTMPWAAARSSVATTRRPRSSAPPCLRDA